MPHFDFGHSRFRLAILGGVFLSLVVGDFLFESVRPSAAVGQESQSQLEAREAAENSAGIKKVAIGFNGRWCVGRWTPLHIEHQCQNVAAIELETMDGDGVPLRYLFDVQSASDFKDVSGIGAVAKSETEIETVVRVGRMNSYVAVVLKDGEGQAIARKKIRFSAGGELTVPLPATTMISLDFGTDIGLDSFFASSRGGVQNRLSLHFDSTDELPVFYEALDCVEHIYIGTRSFDDRAEWSPAILSALTEWVSRGGNLLVSVGENGQLWCGANGLLKDLIPGEFQGIESLPTTGQIEKYVGNDPDVLVARGGTPLTISHIEMNDLDSNDLTEGEFTLFARRASGFGTVSVSMFDLDDPLVRDWNGQGGLITKFSSTSLGRTRGGETKTTAGDTRLGFTDLSGQLRVPLDQFDGVGFISFTMVALLISAFILVIGPGDYFLLKYVFRRMQWTWLTFPIWVALFGGLAYGIFSVSKPTRPRINHVELIDIDAATKRSRGMVWTQTYSPKTENLDFELPDSNSICGDFSRSEVGWLGLAGTGLGGMQTVARSSLFQSEYRCVADGQSNRLESVPLQVASSKTLYSQFSSDVDSMKFVNTLKYDARIGTLTGSLGNPLDVELKDCVVFFRTKVFPISEPVAANGNVLLTGASSLSLDNFLKPRNNEGQTSNVIWDKEDINIPRIINMMMFFRATGYDDLTNDLHGIVDLSSHLQLNQAILVGRINRASTPVRINGQVPDDQFDTQWTFVRVVFSVEEKKRK